MADLTTGIDFTRDLIQGQTYTFVTKPNPRSPTGRKYIGTFLSYGPDLIRVNSMGKPLTLFLINIQGVTPYSRMGGKYKSRSKRIKTHRRGGKSKHRRSKSHHRRSVKSRK